MTINNPPIIAGCVIQTGIYTGNDTVNRAIAHGLAGVPKIVLITAAASGWLFTILDAEANIGKTAVTYLAETAPGAANFYVGNATSYANSANATGVTYYWVALR